MQLKIQRIFSGSLGGLCLIIYLYINDNLSYIPGISNSTNLNYTIFMIILVMFLGAIVAYYAKQKEPIKMLLSGFTAPLLF